MKEKTLLRTGIVLILLGFLGITPVMAATDLDLTRKTMGEFGTTDIFNSGNFSVLSELGIRPVMPPVDPSLTGKYRGWFGTTDNFNSGNLSALSELASESAFRDLPLKSEISDSLKPTNFSQYFKDNPVTWDPLFLYYAKRNANRIPQCRLG